MNISISDALKAKCPNIVLSVIESEVKIEPSSPELLEEINQICEQITTNTPVNQINQIPAIATSRKAYKALGKDPSRYRLSAEALMRRIVKGKGLYHINNVVDLINLTSIQSGFSIGGYNLDAIEGEVVFDIGGTEPYDAIGRGTLNIENLPVFKDEKGTFGSPTSDSTRTMITNETTRFLMVIISFDGNEGLEEATNLAHRLIKTYG
ncbi:MAG: B3/4 domain-containing protein [Saprospiraceae bacterium]